MNTSSKWTALILAAGKGTRMKSETPKVLHPLLGRPMLAWILEAASEAGVADVVAVVGFGRGRILEEVGPHYENVRWAIQKKQNGTGHAVQCARKELSDQEGKILILAGDTPLVRGETLREFLAAHEASDAAATVLSFQAQNPRGYGRLVRNTDGYLERIVEHRDADPNELAIDEVNSGIYAVGARDLFAVIDTISSNNAQGEIYLTDFVAGLRRRGHRVGVHRAEDATEFRGINSRVELAELTRVLRQRKNLELMQEGVTLDDPDTTHVDIMVDVGRDTLLAAGVHLQGNTRIGTGCRIGVGSVLRDTRIADGVQIQPYSVTDGALVGPAAQVGPFAHLRPGAELSEGVKVGNFVEVKNARIGVGSKASHLSYIGDSDIGRDANVGAGVITCNYDGKAKHHTAIGDGAFIGSNSVLVAPIAVGNGAYVAAGSAVSRNVPSGALAIARARQENKPDYVEKMGRRSPKEPAGDPDESA